MLQREPCRAVTAPCTSAPTAYAGHSTGRPSRETREESAEHALLLLMPPNDRRRRALRKIAMFLVWIAVGMGVFAYVNGRWLRLDRAPSATTLGGAVRAALIEGAVMSTFVSVLLVMGWRDRRKRRHLDTETLATVGYADLAAYQSRSATAETSGLNGLTAAKEQARQWLAGRSPEACVEIVAPEGRTSRVVAVITSDEDIDV